MPDKTKLRRQDFWTALVMIAASLFFLYKTSEIPFFRANAAGVEAGRWYNSAAIVPYGLFTGLLLLAVALLVVAIRQGGAPRGLLDLGAATWIRSPAGARTLAVAAIMLAYIFGLVPRVDFTIASALVICALIYGFHDLRARATSIALFAVLSPSLYALIAHFPQSQWNAPHDDDWVALGAFLALSIGMLWETRRATGRIDGYIKAAPLIAFLIPLLLVIVMAFGFRQNVPNRTGLLFGQIEYHYYVTLRPWRAGASRE
ncbi:hypothetical protein [Algihabitans albus]|uniref:hypothetical protein n=1 Tax=Algihabitans albus TaxID=2164067 RepID=UPI000E5CCB80|nr:hypothetical protein [Algihabitans albus]